MKKFIQLIFLVTVFAFGFAYSGTTPGASPCGGLLVDRILIMDGNVYVRFQNLVASTLYDYHMKINDVGNSQTKAFLALLIDAKNNNTTMRAWWTGSYSGNQPVYMQDLITITGLSEELH